MDLSGLVFTFAFDLAATLFAAGFLFAVAISVSFVHLSLAIISQIKVGLGGLLRFLDKPMQQHHPAVMHGE
ncbi:MAG: hypothetical protein V7720_17180 [Halioglobus sp.]